MRRSSSRSASTTWPRTSFTWCSRRLPDAPEGTKGISLFIVPKVLVDDSGKLGEVNDVVCAGIEHKLGINGNPTCTMKFGEKGKGAVGYLVGEANRGLEYMFIMMNAARFSVGVQGYAVADRAYQHSLEYAKERVQMADAATRDRRRRCASSSIPTCAAC